MTTGRQAKRRLPTRAMLFLSVVGPGIIAANADNDAGGILQYSQAGAQYRYAMLWVLLLVTISLAICQEMGARMGAVTGKGLADLIREQYGVRVTLFAMATLLVANFATTVSEFAGITAAVEIFAPPHLRAIARWIVVPLTAVVIWLTVTRGSYKRLERILLTASLLYLAYIGSAILSHPVWPQVFRESLWPSWTGVRVDKDYVLMIVGLIGTTITPWGQFYIQSSVRDKGIRADEYGYTRADVLFGAFFTNLIAFFIIVCCGATLFGSHKQFGDVAEVGLALQPIAGKLALTLFAIGLFNASCFGAITVPISTAYAFSESLGSESGLGRFRREAPMFVAVFTLQLVLAAATVLVLGGAGLSFLILLPNIVGAILLPIILIISLKLINNPTVMGRYRNSRIYNIIAWITIVVLVALSVTLGVLQLIPAK